MNAFLWHGLAMAVAWLVLLPAGALVARFFKVRRRQDYPYQLDDKVWWNTHRALQSLGAALAVWAAWIVWVELGRTVDWPVLHVRLGILALGSLAVQMVSPLLRGTKGGPTGTYADPYDPQTWRGDHFDMTPRRRVFEFVHKKLGYLGMAVAAGAVWTGIDAAGLADWWKLPVSLAVLVFAGLFAWFTVTRGRVDTWQAIWGPFER